jgi:hypothetical protein
VLLLLLLLLLLGIWCGAASTASMLCGMLSSMAVCSTTNGSQGMLGCRKANTRLQPSTAKWDSQQRSCRCAQVKCKCLLVSVGASKLNAVDR